MSRAILMPRIQASYSAMLLAHQNLSFVVAGKCCPDSDINTAPIPDPLELSAPSKNILQPGYESDMSSPTNNTSSSGKYVLSGSYPSSTGFSAS